MIIYTKQNAEANFRLGVFITLTFVLKNTTLECYCFSDDPDVV